jgi:DNA invertase Pin-like site-specific DNA recombinase
MATNRGELLRTIQGKLRLLASLSNDVDSLIEVTRREEQNLRSALSSLLPGVARGRPGRPPARGGAGGPRKRGRAFKFTDDQAGAFRKRVEGGETATALAKELKVSLPTMYNTLKRVGWKGKRGRPRK